MDFTKLIILLCCTYYSFASQHSHTIPVEGYETELQYLGQHVEIPETPVKVIKITKTIAVKVPVPYPVKVKERVPYPVHIAKPYPVPVPQIIKVPVASHNHNNEHVADVRHDNDQNPHQFRGQQDNSYQVQESSHDSPGSGHSYGSLPEVQAYNGGNLGHGQNIESYGEEYPSGEGSSNNSYDSPSQSFYGNSGTNEGNDSFESKSYDQAIKEYLHKNNPNGAYGSGAGSNNYNYH